MNYQQQYTDWDGRVFYYHQGKRVYLDGAKYLGTEARALTEEERKEMAERRAAAEQEPVWRKGMALEDITLDFQDERANTTMERIIFRHSPVKLWLDLDGNFHESENDESDSPSLVDLSVYAGDAGEVQPAHAQAFNHFVHNASAYEKRLKEHLMSKMREIVDSGIRANDTPELRAFIKDHALRQQRTLNNLVSWIGLGLSDHLYDPVGFISFDFECGWDEEHGFSVLMHMGRVVADSEISAFACGGDMLLRAAIEAQGSTNGYDIKLH